MLGISEISKPGDPQFAYFDPGSGESYTEAIQMFEEFLKLEGPFDGVLAFSQGGRMARV
jgi:hypothetical protein